MQLLQHIMARAKPVYIFTQRSAPPFVAYNTLIYCPYSSELRRGVRITSRGVAFRVAKPGLSAISTPSFDGLATSKPCKKLASVKCTSWRASEIPGHDRLPEPKGMSSKFWPPTPLSLWPVKNHSGWSLWGSDHVHLSRWIFQAFTIKHVPVGIWYPVERVQSSIAAWRLIIGAGGYKRNVS